jgi:sn-glycerol 3-phosphate transport system ATP-binding protein
VAETASALSIEELLDKKPRELSGGQRQRVALGRAIIRRPEAFLFDEPLSNLDAVLRERVRHELKEMFSKADTTVVYVTHDQVEAMTLADQVVVLNQGTVQQIGSPDQLYHRPANRFVASFIGSPAMNLFEAQLERGRMPLGAATISTEVDHTGPATVGIRPEAIRAGDGGDIIARVAWVEPLGGRYLIGARIDSVVLTLVGSERPKAEELHLTINPLEMHVFDANTGESLSRGAVSRAVRG